MYIHTHHTHLCSAFVVESEDKFSLSALTLADKVRSRGGLTVSQHHLRGVGSRDHAVEPRELNQVPQVLRVLLRDGPAGVGMRGVRGETVRKVLSVVKFDENAVVFGRLMRFKGV